MRTPRRIKNRKLLLFSIVSAVPGAVLLLLVVLLGIDSHIMGHPNVERMNRITKKNLEDKMKKTKMRFRAPFEDHGKDDRTVYVFGGSSLIISDGKTFPCYLDKELQNMGYRVTVSNKGGTGWDSFYVKQSVNDVLKKAKRKPALFVFYLGHNDYDNVYNFDFNNIHGESANLADSLPGVKTLIRISYILTAQKQRKLYSKNNEKYNYMLYTRLKAPIIINALQAARLASLDSSAYKDINLLIREYYVKNMAEIIKQSQRLGIPVIVCTVVGNLQMEPYGNYDEVTGNYRRGMAAAYYDTKIALLTRAKDGEIMTYDLRAKSPLNDDIRAMAQPGVHILDIEKELREEHFLFGNDDFLDYFHLKDKTHRKFGKLIAEFIGRNKILARDDLSGK